MPSAEAFKDNICLNKPPSHVGGGSVELEHKHDAEKKEKWHLHTPLRKEFKGILLVFFNAAMQIKEENTKKKLWTCVGETPRLDPQSVKFVCENFLYFYSVALHVSHI